MTSKRFLAFLLALCMLIAVLPVGAAAIDARASLSAKDQKLYDLVRAEIEKIAAGTIATTKIKVSVSGFKAAWKPSELGVTISSDDNYTTAGALLMMKMQAFCADHPSDVLNALLYDLPYDLYWYDKTQSYLCGVDDTVVRIGNTLYPSSYRQDAPTDTVTLTFVYELKVSAEYGREYTKTTTKSVKNQAQSIVKKYAGKSDYEKLLGYSTELCQMTDYNDAAMSGDSVVYGNPWQIIYVFDGYANTKVVCEGYAKAFQYLCDLTTFDSPLVESHIVSGNMAKSSGSNNPHMWNVVTMDDGKNYLADITNCDGHGDPTDLLLRGTAPLSSGGYKFGNLTYTYDTSTKRVWPDSLLTLATQDYKPGTSGVIVGDVNADGKVDATDRMILARYLAGWEGYKAKIKNMKAADIDGDGSVTATDRMILARKLAGWSGYDRYFR
ncbi:MAG: hypothetical protein IKQ87_07195 [Clostridia bacterium]|nr:hypothetical protein [Clostridia bacterium]